MPPPPPCHRRRPQEFAKLLPREVVAPGAPVACVTPAVAARLGLPAGCVVCGGTTDSIAAFVAAGVSEVGQAVTSLGSTLAVKMLSEARVDDASCGVYSHRLGARRRGAAGVLGAAGRAAPRSAGACCGRFRPGAAGVAGR